MSFANNERKVSLWCAPADDGGVVQLHSPDRHGGENYQYHNELAIDVEAVKYEAKEYIEQRKWGVKEGRWSSGSIRSRSRPTMRRRPRKKRGRKAKVA